MAKTNEIVRLSEGKGENKVVYSYTADSIKKYVKEELVSAVESGEQSPLMRLLHLRRGNLNFVKKDCADAILDKIEDFKKRVKTEVNVTIEHIDGGYVKTIKDIVDESFESLMKNENFIKKMIVENPIQVIEMGLFKDYINNDNNMFIHLFNSLLASKDPNARILADKLYNKYIVKDIDKMMMIAKNPKAEKYVDEILSGDHIQNKTQYGKFAKIAVKNNPAIWIRVNAKKMAPADILSMVKTNILHVPSIMNMLTQLDAATAKRYLKIMIKHSNALLQAKVDEINSIADPQERKQKQDQLKVEIKDYISEFSASAKTVAGYVLFCESNKLQEKTDELNSEALKLHGNRENEINLQYKKTEATATKILEQHRSKKALEALEVDTDELRSYIFMAVSKDMGLKNFQKDESKTFMEVMKARLKEIDKKFPKDAYPDNNKELKNKVVRDTLKDLLAGKVKTKLGQKLHNSSIPKREEIAKKLTDERVGIIVDEKYSELIKEFEIKYNEALQHYAELRDNKVEASLEVAQKQIDKNEASKNKKIEKLKKKSDELIDTIKSENDLGL
ncbi:MAG: hypothetical protein IKA36_04655 [Clostridia bacterium]|nr:hypothetical protein [Clostridia bacterium]